MKIACVIFLVCSLAGISWTQVKVSARTDKPAYRVGDTIHVTVQAYNPARDTVTLRFPSSCQAGYHIDDFSLLQHVGCLTVLSSRTIPPLDSVSWQSLPYPFRNSGWPFLAPGMHSLVGEVPGYGVSDTIRIRVDGVTSASREGHGPRGYELGQNFPNPFNGETSIPFSLPHAGRVRIELINTLGANVRTLLDDIQAAGPHVIHMDLGGLSSGTYWYCLHAEGKLQVKRLLVLK
jgi:hypothetical protein